MAVGCAIAQSDELAFLTLKFLTLFFLGELVFF